MKTAIAWKSGDEHWQHVRPPLSPLAAQLAGNWSARSPARASTSRPRNGYRWQRLYD
jgi:hypothetical protein